ncbi:DUF3934 family protein [Escherichia coli]
MSKRRSTVRGSGSKNWNTTQASTFHKNCARPVKAKR